MHLIPGDEAYRLTGKGDFKKGLVAWVRQRIGQGGGSYEGTAVLDVVQKSGNFIDPEPELGTTEDFVVFRQDAGVETQRQLAE